MGFIIFIITIQEPLSTPLETTPALCAPGGPVGGLFLTGSSLKVKKEGPRQINSMLDPWSMCRNNELITV